MTEWESSPDRSTTERALLRVLRDEPAIENAGHVVAVLLDVIDERIRDAWRNLAPTKAEPNVQKVVIDINGEVDPSRVARMTLDAFERADWARCKKTIDVARDLAHEACKHLGFVDGYDTYAGGLVELTKAELDAITDAVTDCAMEGLENASDLEATWGEHWQERRAIAMGALDRLRSGLKDEPEEEPNAKCAAVSYIEREDGRFLVVWNRRYKGWSLPGGMVERNESVAGAQERELKEETTLDTRDSWCIYSGPAQEGTSQPGRATYVHVYKVEASGEPKETELGCPVTWMTREEFLESTPFAAFYTKMFAGRPRMDHPKEREAQATNETRAGNAAEARRDGGRDRA
jgi:ADP-ribose pyrophosphatase YjhB (NUDIX family)